MTIATDKVVSIDYVLRNDDGDILDQSAPESPLSYLHGHHNLISGLEAALLGKTTGDRVEASIAPADAYGEYDANLVEQVPRQMFQGIDTIEPGMQFQAQTPQGVQVVTVREATVDTVTVDGNHALAGQTLHFDVTVKEVRDASAEELSHGHAHGPGGHHH